MTTRIRLKEWEVRPTFKDSLNERSVVVGQAIKPESFVYVPIYQHCHCLSIETDVTTMSATHIDSCLNPLIQRTSFEAHSQLNRVVIKLTFQELPNLLSQLHKFGSESDMGFV